MNEVLGRTLFELNVSNLDPATERQASVTSESRWDERIPRFCVDRGAKILFREAAAFAESELLDCLLSICF